MQTFAINLKVSVPPISQRYLHRHTSPWYKLQCPLTTNFSSPILEQFSAAEGNKRMSYKEYMKKCRACNILAMHMQQKKSQNEEYDLSVTDN